MSLLRASEGQDEVARVGSYYSLKGGSIQVALSSLIKGRVAQL